MSLTANFDFCVELGIAQVREIFHLAFKSEDRYPHNVGPLTRDLAGQQATIYVRVMDDGDRDARLTFVDDKHIGFSFPIDIEVQVPDAPDPSLSSITMRSRVEVPALLTDWDEAGETVLGLSFAEIVAGDVVIAELDGLPSIDVGRFTEAIHTAYDGVPHQYSQGPNTLTLYDGNRDTTLEPSNAATPFEIEAALENHLGREFLKITAPIHVDIPNVPGLGTPYRTFGHMLFFREVVRSDSTVSVAMGNEPAAPAAGDPDLRTTISLDTAHVAKTAVQNMLAPLAVSAINGFGTITEPGFTDAGARDLLRAEVAAYLQPLRFPVYSPQSGDRDEPLGTPVGFLLVADEVLAILMNRRDDSVADHAPDNFLDGGALALAVGRAKVDEEIAQVVADEFPGLDNGGFHMETEEGDATLKSLSVVPSDPDTHDESEGHLWISGDAEVHIDCWPDPDVSFDGPIFIDATREDVDGECQLHLEAVVGDFDFDQSCCDVFIDLIIPIVGWVMLGVIESTIDRVGGELAEEIGGSQERAIQPIPPVVNGIAEVHACLDDLNIFSQGFVFTGSIEIRRLGTSYEDLDEDRDLPRP